MKKKKSSWTTVSKQAEKQIPDFPATTATLSINVSDTKRDCATHGEMQASVNIAIEGQFTGTIMTLNFKLGLLTAQQSLMY